MSARYVTSCVHSTYEAIHPMVEAARDISRATFLKHVDRENLREVEAELGYSRHPRQGLTMAGDYHVSYHRSTFCGRPCWFFTWSAIEHVFVCSNGAYASAKAKQERAA